jgi:TolB protein
MIDLVTGESSTVFSGDAHASFTRPTGENLVVFDDTPGHERLERRSTSGSLLAVLTESPRQGFVNPWLYHRDGTELVIADDGGLRRITNGGSDIATLWEPTGRECAPVRWWDGETLLAICHGEISPLIHEWYHQLWLIPMDGSAGSALTALPTEEVMVVDFGFFDAWPTESSTVVQWLGDCSAAAVYNLLANGTTVDLTGGHVQSFIEVVDDHMTVKSWDGCGADRGAVWITDLDGHRLLELIPAVGDARGVGSVVGLGTVYP